MIFKIKKTLETLLELTEKKNHTRIKISLVRECIRLNDVDALTKLMEKMKKEKGMP